MTRILTNNEEDLFETNIIQKALKLVDLACYLAEMAKERSYHKYDKDGMDRKSNQRCRESIRRN